MAQQLPDSYYRTPFKFNGKELDEETGLYYYGARYYDPKISIWLSVDPLAESFPNWNPYNYTMQNPINLVDPDGRAPLDWILLTGNKAYWYGGNYGDKSNLKHTFKATSGMNNVEYDDGSFKNLQKAKFQYVRSAGPTVEGKYKINLEPDPNRVAKGSSTTGELFRNSEGGIEKLPTYIESSKTPGMGWTYEAWGENRARLEPISVQQPHDEDGNLYNRDLNSFYVHDSVKGHSHGCHEVETELFNFLKQYREDGNSKIEVQVKYPNKNHVTNGGTKKDE